MSQSMYPDNNRNMKRSAGAPHPQRPDPRELQRRRSAAPQNGRPAPAGQRQIPRDHMPPKRAGDVRRPPERKAPPRPKPETVKISSSAAVKEKKMGTNMILASVLLCLVLVLGVVFGVQSCIKGDDEDDYTGNDKVVLSTTSSDEADLRLPAYLRPAKYTDDTKNLSIDSGYGILIDLDSNTVIASKGGDEKIYPASMTKVMTLIVAYENLSSLDKTYTFNAEMLDELYLANASVAGFKAGETVSARDLLYGAILPSGGDATNALAELVAGSEEDFAFLMNEKVAELGLKNTHFVTASGLHHDDHYTTCHDMAKILEYAISKPEMREILSTYRYTTAPTAQHPEGILLTSTLYSRMKGDEVGEGFYVQGGKTGYTNEGKNCLCTFAANCREDESLTAKPQYILVTAFAVGEYAPVYDAIDVYGEYCAY